jgi:acetoacetyl-CoA synthetase
MSNSLYWQPTDEHRTNFTRFKQYCYRRYPELFNLKPEELEFKDFYRWSIANSAAFWQAVAGFSGLKLAADQREFVLSDENNIRKDFTKIPWLSSWFTKSKLNFAEILLGNKSQATAIYTYNELGEEGETSYEQLFQLVEQLATVLESQGLKEGDCVAAICANRVTTVALMLATLALGGVWSSCSPEMGVKALYDRLSQLKIKILFVTPSYLYRGKHDVTENVFQLIEKITFEKIVFCSLPSQDFNQSNQFLLSELLNKVHQKPLEFKKFPFQKLGFILFSSGTTGAPKCLLHSIGGTVIEHLKEHLLHCNFSPNDTVFYQTNCSWMMWNWLTSCLAVGSSIVLYEGDPLAKKGSILFEMIDKLQISVFGTNARYLAEIKQSYFKLNGAQPNKNFNLSSLRSVLSTGSVLNSDAYKFVANAIKPLSVTSLQLSSISGGTDILGCFALGSSDKPVVTGEFQTRSLGLAVEVFDEKGIINPPNTQGELVCTAPFPSMPLGFLNDPLGEKFYSTYFSRFQGVWHHGDFVELTPSDGMIFHGRSDTTLNPNGVRIGTGEIYNQLEQLESEEGLGIIEGLALGLRNKKGDEEFILFIVFKNEVSLDENIAKTIRRNFKTKLSPFHIPQKIIQADKLPTTLNGKITELPLKRALETAVSSEINLPSANLPFENKAISDLVAKYTKGEHY